MGIYFTIFGILTFFVLIESRKLYNIEKQQHNVLAIRINKWNIKILILGITIVLIAGIRWQIGTDWDNFLSDFQYMKNASWRGVMSSIYGMTYGIGYVLMTYSFAKAVGNYSLFLAFQAIVIVSCVYPVIYKHSKYPSISFLGLWAYSFGYAFAVPRSGIAMAICYLAFDAYTEKKYVKTGILVILATMFHNTAILFFSIFFIDKKVITSVQLICIFCIAIILSFFIQFFLSKIATFSFIPLSYSMRLNDYLRNNTDFGGVGGPIRIITRGFVLICIIIYLWNKRNNRQINILVNMYVFSIVIYIVSSNISDVFIRMAYNFEDISQFIIFSECLSSTKDKYNNFVLRILMIVFFILKMLGRLLGNELLVPFRTVF